MREHITVNSTPFLSQQPSIFDGTVPRESLLNFSEDIPGGRYSSSSGSTESLMTMVVACILTWKYPLSTKGQSFLNCLLSHLICSYSGNDIHWGYFLHILFSRLHSWEIPVNWYLQPWLVASWHHSVLRRRKRKLENIRKLKIVRVSVTATASYHAKRSKCVVHLPRWPRSAWSQACWCRRPSSRRWAALHEHHPETVHVRLHGGMPAPVVLQRAAAEGAHHGRGHQHVCRPPDWAARAQSSDHCI